MRLTTAILDRFAAARSLDELAKPHIAAGVGVGEAYRRVLGDADLDNRLRMDADAAMRDRMYGKCS